MGTDRGIGKIPGSPFIVKNWEM
ncbi:MAG: hypothetical protein QG610_1020, partial [Euryarchaeota archaeon]|nr:hypothetical protein [Euryarchaeota archaeon]